MTAHRVPVVLAGHALRSLRDSGYSLAAALGEVVDNSLEANANQVTIRLEEDGGGLLRRRPRHVHRIAVADNGDGMDPTLLHHYPQLGFSTRYMSTTTIGKYGVGAKLAALNFCTRIDVWSRTDASEPWRNVYLDLDEAMVTDEQDGESLIAAPTEAPVPKELADLLPPASGTLVVWSHVDRLEEGRFAADADALRVEVERELSRMFRHFLHGGIGIRVDDATLVPHDPLFLMQGARSDAVLRAHYSQPGVEPQYDVRDHYPAEVVADVDLEFRGNHLRVRVTLAPPEVLRTRAKGDDDLNRALHVSENLGALSLVRLDREINYANIPGVLPFGVQEPDRFIGIEITFPPALDDYMGVRNVKRGVEPHGELRSLIRAELTRWIPVARTKIQDHWGHARRRFGHTHGEHQAILEAAAAVDRTLPKRPARPADPARDAEVRRSLSRDIGHDDDATAAEYLDRISSLPFVLETIDLGTDDLIAVDHLHDQIIIRLNERHRFYREAWEPVRDIATAPRGTITGAQAIKTAQRTIEALTLLVIAYAKAESMRAEGDAEAAAAVRADLGRFLDVFLEQVRDVM